MKKWQEIVLPLCFACVQRKSHLVGKVGFAKQKSDEVAM